MDDRPEPLDTPEPKKSDLQCAACGSCNLRYIGQTPKPPWSELLTHEDDRCPDWYAESEYQEFCEYLEREYGISYADWHREMRKESTMSEARKRELPSTESSAATCPQAALSEPIPIPQVEVLRQLYLPACSPKAVTWSRPIKQTTSRPRRMLHLPTSSSKMHG